MFLAVRYAPISSSAPRPLGAAYVPILLSEIEQEQRPSGNGDCEAIVVGAGLCDGEGERGVAVFRSNFCGRKDRGRTFWSNCRGRMECGRIWWKPSGRKRYLFASSRLTIIMWGICCESTLALKVAKTSSHYDRFAIPVPARSLLLFDLA